MFSRKNRRANTEIRPDSSSSSRESTKSSRSLFSLPKTLYRTSTTFSDQAEDVKGPLGLNLLYSPPTPDIDFVFIHGLGGSSRKTWSKSPLQSHYWPKEWLPKDPAFKNVRIHSYGYDSYYLKGKEDCLNIHHIGKSFLGALSTSPCIMNSGTSIIFIGHSMGGLVMKKAFILAKQDTRHKTLAERINAFYFLATPHRGSDSAKTLKKLLKVAYDRAYVGDLEPNSGAVQVINDEFRHLSAELELWSFYETQDMRIVNSLIVDPESAVLGYREEKQIPMAADHRSICKFDTPEDPNYALLRNSLASTVSRTATAILELNIKQGRERIKSLRKYLDVSDVLDDDFANVCEARMHGSCGWISAKASYIRWRDGEVGNDRTLWIKGKPATGKSVLAGYVIDELKDSGQACSYFFFKHGDKSKSNLSRCLRSLAFQMVSSNAEASDAILRMQADGVSLDRAEERTLWRTLFLSGIFQVPMTRHYWVIDALDECSNPLVLLHAILSKMDESIPLRILVTSRGTVDLDQGFSVIPPNLVQTLPISTKDTQSDLRLLVEGRTQISGVMGPDDRDTLAEKILDKSKGSFLWTILVLEELLRCHSKKEIHQILENVPRGMESLYKRILDYMSQAARGKELAKTILMWAACAVRPLTISELDGALSLDIHDSFPRLEESIAALCGQLVVVDKYGRVKMVHETAREFLVAGGLESEFSIDKTKAHTRMAYVCLSYLIGEEMKPPRNSRRRYSANLPATRLDFAAYAFTEYSYHISRADPSAAETFQIVVQFLKSNVLTWIQMIAESRNLNHLIRASKHLKAYANACAAERSPLDPRIQAIRQWSTDLARIPAMFANALTVSPSAIHSLIPPFCPTESTVFNTGGSGRRLEVLGTPNKQWDDRLLCVDFRQGQPRTLRYGDEFLAVGLSSGTVILYYATSYQEYKVLDHGEAVKFIAFKAKTDLVVTCGMKLAKVWDIRSGQVVHSLASPPRPLGMEFDEERLLIASGNNYVATWDLGHNSQPESVQRPWYNSDTSETNPAPRGTPCALALSTSHGMIAVAYSGQPITLWDMEESAYAGSCGKKLSNGETSTHVVVALAFNPNPDIGLLAVAYLDGDLALLDPFSDQQLQCFRANCQTLAPSPNGRLLAAGGANGIIHVYEFDTLKLLYQVKSSNSYIKQLAFTRDNMLLADIRGAQCTVWEPEALLRESMNDDSSGASFTTVVEAVSMEAKAKITSMVVHHTSEVIFCGKDDGSVILYERKMATSLRTLYSHKSPVRLLTWIKQRDALLSIDASNRIFLHKVHKSADKVWLSDPTELFKSHLDSEKAIIDVLVGEVAGKFLVLTRESDHLFNLDNGEHERQQTYPQMPAIHKWLPHPTSSLHLIRVNNFKVCVYCWNDWSEISSIALSLDEKAELKSASLYSHGHKQRIVLNLLYPENSVNINRIAILDADSLSVRNHDSTSSLGKQLNTVMVLDRPPTDQGGENLVITSSSGALLCSSVTAFELSIAHIIGIDESMNVIFLNRSFWVCSVDLNKLETAQHKDPPTIDIFQHFFLPCDWFAGRRDIVSILAKRDIVLTRGGDLAVIRGGLDYSKKVSIG